MALKDPDLEAFNDQGVSAPLPGEGSVISDPTLTQAETPPEPEKEPEREPFSPEPPPPDDPREIIDEFVGGVEKADKAKSFAEKKRAAEQELARRLAQGRAEVEKIEGLKEFADVLQQDPEFAQQVGELYQRRSGAPAAGAPPYSDPPVSNGTGEKGSEEMAQLRQQVADLSRGLMKHSIQAATQIVQGRHQLTQEDMASVIYTAVQNGYLRPGMSQSDVEVQLENARKIAFFERAKGAGQKEFLGKVEQRQRAVTAQGASAGGGKPAYDVSNKSFAEIRRDAKLAGSKGL